MTDKDRIEQLEAELNDLRQQLALLAEYAGHHLRLVRQEASLPAIGFGPREDDPDRAVARFMRALQRGHA